MRFIKICTIKNGYFDFFNGNDYFIFKMLFLSVLLEGVIFKKIKFNLFFFVNGFKNYSTKEKSACSTSK